MLDPKFILNNISVVAESIRDRNVDVDLAALERAAARRKELLQQQDELRHRRKALAKQPADEAHNQEGRKIKERLAEIEGEVRAVDANYQALLTSVPNLIHPDTPRGRDEDDCVTLSTWGAPPAFDFPPQDHVQLGQSLDLIDFERAASISGNKFYYLKNEAALLELALTRYAVDMALKRGYRLYITPDVVHQNVAAALGFNPRGNESNMYTIADTDLCLIGTSEITLGAYYGGQTIPRTDLPIRMVGISHCFRREAGAAGRSGRGLFRVHQFTKVELFVIAEPQGAEVLHEELLDLEKEIFIGLEIPFRVRDICSGDLGAPVYRKFDIEAWMPGKERQESAAAHDTRAAVYDSSASAGDANTEAHDINAAARDTNAGAPSSHAASAHGSWGEVTSASNCTDYQARRLRTRTVDKDGKSCFVSMLNGTAVAVSRAIVALLENHQRADGTIRIPPLLHPYTGFTTIGA